MKKTSINVINKHCYKIYDNNKNQCIIFSHGTPVLMADENGFHRLWDDWSITTQRDINKAGFECVYGMKMNKKLWDSMPVENYL